MASIVDTSVKNFNSTMFGAPVLSGTAGALIALLDAVLVNGFDLKTASGLTIAGGVASLPFTGSHSAQLDSVILIAGITGAYASLNGEQKVTAVGAGVVKFATSMADGVAAGPITFKMAPAGFEKPFSKLNVGVYRSLDPASSRMLFRVDDTGTTQARVVGYEVMTDVDTGTGAFPTAVQISGGGYWDKSLVANAVSVTWAIHADTRMFYFTPQPGMVSTAAAVGGVTRCFGDLFAYRPGGDAYACVLSYSAVNSPNSAPSGTVFGGGQGLTFAAPRAYTGLGSAVLNVTYPFLGNTVGASASASGRDSFLGPFPSAVDGSLQLSKKFISGGTATPPRGELPGVYHAPQTLLFDTFRQLDRTPGAGVLAGRVLQAISALDNGVAPSATTTSTNCGAGFIDITGPWR